MRKDIEGVMELAKEKRLIVVCDEIYDHFVYEGKHVSILSDSDWRDHVIYVNGFSKTYAMTGWRIGYVVAKKEIIEKFKVFAMNNFTCVNNFVQRAAITALEMPQEFFKEILNEYRKRRNFIYHKLNKISGIRATMPKGAFYVFPNIKKILKEKNISTSDFTVKLLKEKGVVTLPGSPAFSFKAGKGHIRMAFTIPIERMEEGLERLRDF